jgi:uncharacterized membrane protein YedE/YeeE
MGFACAVSLAAYQYKKRSSVEKPLLCSTPEPCECSFDSVPNGGKPDTKLVAGAAMFGVGWGLTGICPGPALVGAALGSSSTVYFYLPAFFLAKSLTVYVTKRPAIPVDVDGTVDERDRTDPAAAGLDTCGNPIPVELAAKANSWLSLIPPDK